MIRPVFTARLRVAALWFAVLAHALGEMAVRTYAIFKDSHATREIWLGLSFILVGFSAAPAFALAPVIGTVAGGRGRWAIMILAILGGLAAVAWSTYSQVYNGSVFWPSCIGVMAFETAFFAVCCFAVIPEASRSARIPLPQINGLFAVAISGGIFGGLWIGIEQYPHSSAGMPAPLQFGLMGYGLALVCILFARFAPVSPTRFNDGLIRPFARTALAIFRDRLGRNSLLALWALFAIGFTFTQWLMTMPPDPDARYGFFIALIAGLAIGGLNPHPFRTLGFVPYSTMVLVLCTSIGVAFDDWETPAFCLGGFLGLTGAPLLTIYQINQPDNQRGHGGALLLGGWATISGLFLLLLLLWYPETSRSVPVIGWSVFGISLIGMAVSWVVFFRAAFELTVEGLLAPMYRIKALGPGVDALPWRGPLIVIANHSAWFDPLWLNKIVPFASTPMMTSRFFDLPVFGWFVRKVVGAVRVPDVTIRKDAPEIKQVIAALDRGECVFVFPEGWLRRKEEQELKRFGRGIWQILKARPDVPVFACWIDGNWGSFFSHRFGPPMTNKPFDFLRRIKIAVAEPIKVDAATLATHMATRTLLMKQVLEARALMGFPPIDPFKLPTAADDEGAAEKPLEGGAKA